MKKLILFQRSCFKICLILGFLFSSGSVFAQLSGTKYINNTGSGDYLSLSSAINDLNAQGVGAGGVTFYLSEGQIFNEPPMTISVSGSASNPISFKKNGMGANPKIYGMDGVINTSGFKQNGDAIIKITGGDFISFEELSFYDASSNTNRTTQMEYGILVTRNDSDTNASKNISIKYCSFELNPSNQFTIAIYNANMKASGNLINPVFEDTDTNKRCINFKISNNTISSCNAGIVSIGISDIPPYSIYDQNIFIESNTISDIGGHYDVPCFGMDVRWANEINISGNNVSGGQGTTGQLGAVTGIHTFSYDANSSINNNLVSVGSSTVNYNNIIAIYSGANGITNISENEVKDCYGNGQLFAPGGMWMINHYASNTNQVTINDNLIHHNTSSGYSYFINMISVNTLDMDSCNIFNNSIYNNSSNSEGLAAMSCISGDNIHNNNIYNNSAFEGVIGISTNDNDANVYENNIYNNANCYGILGKGNIFRNNIHDLYTTQNRALYGIYVNGGNANIYNNFISRIYAPNSNATDVAVAGIYSRIESNLNVYFNTIYLDNTSNTDNGSSAAIYVNDSYDNSYSHLEMKNNVFVNLSSPGINGKTMVLGKSNNVLTGYSLESNNNCFYTNTALSNRLIYKGGNDEDMNVGGFKSRVEPAENNSFSENPPFVNVSSAPYNLHMQTNVVTKFESGGIPVSMPVNITDDFDGNMRNPVTPDIGADEFNGLGIAKDIEISDMIFSGNKYYANTTVNNFSTKVRNNGVEHVSFKVYRSVSPGAYYDSVSVNNLSPQKDTVVKFPDFNFINGSSYTIKDSVYLPGDQIPSNNVSLSSFQPLKAKPFAILWGDSESRDKLINAINEDGRFANDYDVINMNTFRESLHPWKSVFALFGRSNNTVRDWTDKMRDTLKSFLDNSTSINKKTLLVFGNDLGKFNDGTDPNTTEADSAFYRHYMKANYLQTTWGFNAEGYPYPFWETDGRIRGLDDFNNINDDTAEVSYVYSDLITPANGGTAAIIPLSENGDGDSCVAVTYGDGSTLYNTFYCSISFGSFKVESGGGLKAAPMQSDFSSNTIVSVFETIADWVQLPEIGGENSLPVELSSFNSIINGNSVELKWITASEQNNSGFEIQKRSATGENSFTEWAKIGFKNGAGTTNEAVSYNFPDNNLASGKYSYRLKQIDHNGNFKYYNLSNEIIIGVPAKYDMSQNYPNPFNPVTKINYELAFDSKVSLKIYDMLGREAASLVNNDLQKAGYYTVQLNGINLASGTYFYRITAKGINEKDFIMTKKMVLIK